MLRNLLVLPVSLCLLSVSSSPLCRAGSFPCQPSPLLFLLLAPTSWSSQILTQWPAPCSCGPDLPPCSFRSPVRFYPNALILQSSDLVPLQGACPKAAPQPLSWPVISPAIVLYTHEALPLPRLSVNSLRTGTIPYFFCASLLQHLCPYRAPA